MHPFDPTPHIERIPDTADIEPVISPFDALASAVCILGALVVIGIMLWVAIDGARGASRMEGAVMAHDNATPRPWSLEDGNPLTIVADQGDDYPWFIATAHEGMRETKANAALIVEAVNAFDTLRAEVARLEAENAREPRWQSIDTAPEGDGELLVFCADTGEMFVAFRTSPRSDLWTYARTLHGNEICCRPTHWSHLPERPA